MFHDPYKSLTKVLLAFRGTIFLFCSEFLEHLVGDVEF